MWEPRGIFLDSIDDELVYPLTGNGDVSPLRIIQGPTTLLSATSGIALLLPP
jgi:hypothetical protein